SAERFHLAGVQEILADAGLDASALLTPSSYPSDEEVRDAYVRAGGLPDPMCMDCSGKHAAMLATCVVNRWDTATYLDPEHPLQQAIRGTFQRLTREPVAGVGVDGCGAPLLATSLAGLARAFGTIARAGGDAAEAY